MKALSLVFSPFAVVCCLSTAPSFAAVLKPVAAQDLGQFIGSTIFGAARAPLGVVTKADTNIGIVGVAGRHGEYTLMHTSVLERYGAVLRAPTVSIGQFKLASIMSFHRPGLTLISPEVTVTEPGGR